MTKKLSTSTWAYRTTLLVFCAAFLATSSSASAAECERGTRRIKFDHGKNAATDPGIVSLKAGETFQLEIDGTHPECFDYSYRAIELPVDVRAGQGGLSPADICLQTIVHDGKPRDYLVFITKKDPFPSKCSRVTLPTRDENNPWVVPVRTLGWTAGFAGGFTFDGLTDPSYGLVAAEREVDGMSEKGFQVIRQSERDDDYSLGAAAMVHVFHTDPSRLRLLRWANWAPLTFGLAVNNGSDVRYFLGTSLRFSDQAFLSAGAVFGGRDRLPAGVDLTDNSFTTNSNALNSLDTRTDVGWFVGVSYAFLGDTAKNALEGAVSTPTGTPPGGGKTSAPQVPTGGAPVRITGPDQPLTLTGPAGAQGGKVAITLASGSTTKVTFSLEGAQKDSFTLSQPDCELTTASATCEVAVTPKAGLAPGTYKATLVATPESGDAKMVDVELTVAAP